jgi:hypothetical protein
MFDDGRTIGLHAAPPSAGSIDVRVETRPKANGRGVITVLHRRDNGSNLAGVAKPHVPLLCLETLQKSASPGNRLGPASRRLLIAAGLELPVGYVSMSALPVDDYLADHPQ